MKINFKNNKLPKAKLGDLFVVEDNKDLLMITQDLNQKYYLTSLKTGEMYGWARAIRSIRLIVFYNKQQLD